MIIPPFPAHDLAKLVLGYLAEEQLMTAYDEFLSTSPYLDSMNNEYDRIFMTSLKIILAEYRAVKIFLENCKPYSLRRRLFGCTNLLEVVKFLVQNVDVSKLQAFDGSRGSLENKSAVDNCMSCAVCQSLKLHSCACKNRYSTYSINAPSSDSQMNLETTALEDLPGNHSIRKKQVKTLLKDSRASLSALSSDSNVDKNTAYKTPASEHSLPSVSQNANCRLDPNNTKKHRIKTRAQAHPKQMLTQAVACSTVCTRSNDDFNRMTPSGTFQDFTDGVKGVENINSHVPDSSTAENISTQTAKEICEPSNTVKTAPKQRIFLTVGTINTDSEAQPDSGSNTSNSKPKSNDPKVTILSDIKVDKKLNNNSDMPAVLKNATSTPLMHMQTILINGTPVYKPQPPVLGLKRNFTKDEIMAMPTIIVVPTSGPSQVPPNNQSQVSQLENPCPSTIDTTAPSIDPLVIDVSASRPAESLAKCHNMPSLDQQKVNDTEMLLKTVDAKMVSAPKDSGEPLNKNTPQCLPPLRKSSSTPRRTSHVRVLDFTTPRRILGEAIGEEAADDDNPVEVVISRSPNLHTLAESSNETNTINISSKTSKSESAENNSSEPSKDYNYVTPCPSKKHNWDADLRALAIPNKKEDIPKSCIMPRCRPKISTKSKTSLNEKNNKKKPNEINNKEKPTETSKINDQKVDKPKNIKSKRKSVEVKKPEETDIVVVDNNSMVPVKPTVNIITENDWNTQENDKNLNNKSNNTEPADTPETERLLLQNEIGVKLNISDLLETPYKQALYDIQMETPRFLGPDLPGEPISDIKIMNIPTPRFLNTPKPIQATPSSYSSRPTDYSSGGSYYKPDDQDYILPELGYPVAVTSEQCLKSTNPEESATKEKISKSKNGTKSRPVRKCTKNVSYYNSPQVDKKKQSDDRLDENNGSTLMKAKKIEKEKESSSAKGVTPKPKTKRTSISKKHKTPVKTDTPKTFIKIKPRKVSHVKENAKGRRKSRKTEGDSEKISLCTEQSSKKTYLAVPTKSRRKSSTPRKLPCTKTFSSESLGHKSPEMSNKIILNTTKETLSIQAQDSDNEQVPLHWSDDGSQDAKPSDKKENISSNEAEDILKIKEFIALELQNANLNSQQTDRNSNLHVDLVNRGFDVETAKIIERDLLDETPQVNEFTRLPLVLQSIATENENEAPLRNNNDSASSSSLKIAEVEDDECEDIELSVSECHEESEHFITCSHDDLKDLPQKPISKFKEKFSMEVCIDDGVTVRFRPTTMSVGFDLDPQDENLMRYDQKETELAVNSISNIDKLYTPIKDSIRAQVYEIFDSTLTSIDTPLKDHSPMIQKSETTVTEIVLEVEKMEERPEEKKRKRQHSIDSNESASSNKRTKTETEYLLNSAKIQNIDIESVLSKLHGP